MTTEEMAAAMGYADPRLTQLPEDIMQPSQPEIVTEAPPVESAPQGESPYSGIQEEDLLAAFVPGYEPAAPPSPASPPAPAVTKEADKVSVGAKGFSPEKYQQIKRGPGGDRQREFNAIDQDAMQTGQLFGGLAGQAADAEIAAAKAQSDADQSYILEESRQHGIIAQKKNEYALKEQEESAKAAAISAEGRANYLAALEDFRSSKVNPNELFQSMGKFDQVGTLAAVFVHDFLGAKGIKTSALDTLNKGIERNIDAQIQNIKIKGEAAEGMKTLWEMQRAESASDAEARARVRGFMLQALEDEVTANLGTMKAGLADAKGQAAIAKIQSEKVKAQFEVFKYIDQSTLAKKNQAQQWIAQEMQHSIAQANLSIARSREAREAAEAKAKAAAAKTQGLIPDLSADGKGGMRWRFRDDISKEERAKVLDKVASTNITNRNIEEYRALLRKAKTDGDGNRGALDVGRLTSHEQAKINALHVRILSDKLREDSGLTVTDNEFKRRLAELTENKKWTDADAESIAAGFQARMQEDLHAHIRTRAYNLPENAPERQLRAASEMGYETSNLEARSQWDTGGKIEETPSSNAVQGLERPDVGKKAAETTVDRAISEGATPNKDWASFKGASGGRGTDEVPAGAVHLSTLRARAEKGDNKALEELKEYAGTGSYESGVPRTPADSPYLPNQMPADKGDGKVLREFAQHELELLSQSKSTDVYSQAKAAGVIK